MGTLFEAIIARYKIFKEKHKKGEGDFSSQIETLEKYCKNFLKKYANHEKMDLEIVIRALPDEWDFQGEDGPMEYLMKALDSQYGEANNSDIECKLAETEIFNLQVENETLKKAWIQIDQESRCAACNKVFIDTKDITKGIYVFPNGVLAHKNCMNNPSVCPESNYNFAEDAKYI